MKEIKHVVIVGGGSSAMLAAAYIANNTNFKITMVDKPGGSPIGVGEATLINFAGYMNACGFDFQEWFDACDATYKTGILFPGWTSQKHVWHPFVMNPMRKLDELDVNAPNGFHVDCLKLAKFIKSKLKVNFIEDTVKHQSENYLVCENQTIYADVFIDCTGFKAELQYTNQTNLSHRLICNTAIAGPVQYKDDSERLNYTVCQAVSCGWIWKVPIRTRIGTGIVFNKDITPVEEAKEIFLKHWDNRPEVRKVIDWTPFYKPRLWKNNVIRIGLSGGFIEPLESTGLALAMEGAYQFVKLTESGYHTQATRDLYNSILKSFYEESIDFIAMHYLVNNRKEKFWQEAKKLKRPIQMDYYKDKLEKPLDYPNSQYNFFGGNNWVTWLKQA